MKARGGASGGATGGATGGDGRGGALPHQLSSRRPSQEPARLLSDPQVCAGESGAFAVALLRSIRPHQPSAARKQRLRLNLGRSSPAHAPWLLRPTVVSTILLGAAAAGSAALGYWPRPSGRVRQGPPVREARLRATEVPVHMRRSVARTPAEAPETAPGSPVSTGVRSQVRSAGRSEIHGGATSEALARRVRESATHRSPVPAGRAVAPGDDTSAVLEAVRALRRRHDPARARALLATYLERYPDGTLAEEALAMWIEAAIAQRAGDAPALARRYLSRYPAGPFRDLARQALALAGDSRADTVLAPTNQR